MRTILFILITLLFFSCQKEEQAVHIETDNLKFSKNILNYTITPKHAFDKDGLMFSDQGAWFAYSFPDSLTNYAGFSGPFLMTQQNGVWSSTALAELHMKSNDKTIVWSTAKQESFNSHLEKQFINNTFNLKQTLVFFSGHSAIIQSIITNNSVENKTLTYQWKNQDILADGLTLSATKNEAVLTSSKSNAIGYISFPENTTLKTTDSTYVSIVDEIVLKPGESKQITITQSFIFPEYAMEKEQQQHHKINFDSVLALRKKEKEVQLTALIRNRKQLFKDDKYAMVLAKAQLTLQNNWRIPAGEIKHEGLFPSYHYKWFNGFWAWDSWKHAAGLAYYDTGLAKKQVKLMFEFQEADGFIADCVFRDTTIEAHNYRDTKPPLAAWAVAKIYETDKDTAFIKEMYPKLKKYHYWWYAKRDHDRDSLCEYGSTDGSLVAAKWESGMDNAIRFDAAEIVKNGENAYSLNQESVDLNAYLYAEKLYLSDLATALSFNEDSVQFQTEAGKLKNKLQQQFFDEEDGWFYDTNLEGNEFIKGEGSEGWTALWAKAATTKQAEAVKDIMLDSTKFYTKVPFQTMSADHPEFNPLKGYWRGPNWLDQAYFGVKGLRNYGFHQEADMATVKILEGAEGILGQGKAIRENYHPITGKGLNAKNFSWSAAHCIMLLME